MKPPTYPSCPNGVSAETLVAMTPAELDAHIALCFPADQHRCATRKQPMGPAKGRDRGYRDPDKFKSTNSKPKEKK